MIDRNLSYSQIKTWLACRRQWAYRYRDGYKPKIGKQDFLRGSLLHAGMEHMIIEDAYPSLDLAWSAAIKQWNDEWDVDLKEWIGVEEFLADCRLIVEGAVTSFRQDWSVVEDSEGPLIERRFYTPVPHWKSLVFIPDVVAERKTGPWSGGVFGLDLKSFGKPKPEFAGEVDLQGAIYQRGLRLAGYNALGSVLYQIPTQGPKEPRINADGTQHKGDVATRDRWSAVTGEILTVRSQEYLDGVWEQIVVPVAAEIADDVFDARKWVIPTMEYYQCNWCEFKGPCQARLRGHDEDAILADNFNRRAPRQKGV